MKAEKPIPQDYGTETQEYLPDEDNYDAGETFVHRMGLVAQHAVPLIEAETLKGQRQQRMRMYKMATGQNVPKRKRSGIFKRMRRGGAIANNNRSTLFDKPHASRPIKGHVGYIINPAQNRRMCKGPVNLNRDQYKTFYAMPEHGKRKWARRKEKALKNGNGHILWESLTREGKKTRNPYKTKRSALNKVYHVGGHFAPDIQNYNHVEPGDLNHDRLY